MTELDKFKRRMIRTVARLLLHEKQPEEQVWEALRKESGCDCKLLWQRMRALTIKKLARLLAADDQPEQIAAVARLTATDWLMCDLVLVHEDVDLIGQKEKSTDNKEHYPLAELFSLVQTYGLETRDQQIDGDMVRRIAEGWTTATAYYNKTKYKGHRRQCSAMLMQRRWYQLKEATRAAFYQFWSRYRGNMRVWEEVRVLQPTELQVAIATRYPHVVTQPFPSWEEQIDAGLVILPKEFEERVRNPPKPTQPSSTEGQDPDIVVLEPEIETIELNDSDSDEPNQTITKHLKQPNQTLTPSVSVAGESPDDNNSNSNEFVSIDDHDSSRVPSTDGLSNVKILEATHIPVQNFKAEPIDPVVRVKIEAEDPSDPAVKRQKLSVEMTKFLESTRSEVDPSELRPEETQTEELIKKKVNEYLSYTKSINTNTQSNTDQDITEDNAAEDDATEDVTDDLIQEKAAAFLSRNKTIEHTEPPPDTLTSNADTECDDEDDIIKAKADELVRNTTRDNPKSIEPEEKTSSEDEDLFDDIIKQRADAFVREADTKKQTTTETTSTELQSETADNDLLDGMEIVDDGIEYTEDDDDSRPMIKTETECEESNQEQDTASFDLKLLMDPVVYTLKLDQMTVFIDQPFDSVANSVIIEKALKESKPVNKKGIHDMNNVSVSSDQLSQSTNQESPVSASVRQDVVSQGVSREIDDSASHDFDDDDSDESVDEISDDLKVKSSSYLLKKPRSRSYNPIQLCKNPDFNTRLRRLNVGFFTSPRNMQLLKACKPMTIDLHKAFESKLLDGVLYLKPNDVTSTKNDEVKPEPESVQTASVMPSAMPIQSLIDNAMENYLENQCSTTTSVMECVDLTARPGRPRKDERNKVINLKDINEIRRINQHLLTAQVTPIRAQTDEDAPAQTSEQRQPHAVRIFEADKDKGNTSNENSNTEIVNRRQSTTSKEIPVSENNTDKRKLKHNNHLMNVVVGLQKPNRRIPVPWNKPSAMQKKPKMDEFLLTIDTLNKMILTMSGAEDKITKKRVEWVVNRDGERPSTGSSSKQKYPLKTPGEKSIEERKKEQPVKQPIIQPKPPTYCCWAKEKIMKIENKKRTNLKHQCARLCTCCCRDELLKAYEVLSKHRRKTLMTNHPALLAACTVELEWEQARQLDEACKTIEEVAPATVDGVPTPVFKVVTPSPAPQKRDIIVRKDNNIVASSNRIPIYNTPTPMMVNAGRSHISKYIAITSRETSTRLVLNEPPEHYYISAQTTPVFRATVATQTDEDSAAPLGEAAATARCLDPTLDSNTLNQIVIDGSAPTTRPTVQVLKSPLSAQILKSPTIQVLKPSQVAPKPGEKMMYLSSNSIASQPPGNPIYLGENKILLTTVKFPKSIKASATVTSNEPVAAQNAPPAPPASALALPAGVQLVLPTTGELTYMLEPGVVLDNTQLESLAQILEAVKTQISAAIRPADPQLSPEKLINLSDEENVPKDQLQSPAKASIAPSSSDSANQLTETQISLVSDEVAELNDDENVSKDQTESVPKPTVNAGSTEQSTSESTSQINESQTPVSLLSDEVVKLSDDETDNPPESVASTSELTESQTTALPVSEDQTVDTSLALEEPSVIEETIKANGSNDEVIDLDADEERDKPANEEVTSHSNDESNSRNLLMDLMEMSGISADDAKPQETMSSKQEAVSVSVVNVDHPAPVVTASMKADLPELTAVTSLAELKYACEQDGKFFKLDVKTGCLVRINVCIKKNQKVKKQAPSFYVSNASTSVIDLTDNDEEDNDSNKDQFGKEDVSKNYKVPKIFPKPQTSSIMDQAAVIRNLYQRTGQVPPKIILAKVRRRGRPPKLFDYSAAKEFNRREFDFIEPRVLRQRPERKQYLIEREIDTLNPDTYMEEEYLDSDSGDDEFKPPPYLKYTHMRGISENVRVTSENVAVSSENVRGPSEMRVTSEKSVHGSKVDKTSRRSLLKPFSELTSPLASVTLVSKDDDSSDDEPLAKKAKRVAEVDKRVTEVDSSPAVTTEGVVETIADSPVQEVSDDNQPEQTVGDEQPITADADDMDVDLENCFEPTFLEADDDCILGV